MQPHEVLLFRSDHGWLDCLSLLCHGQPWGPSPPQSCRLTISHPQWSLNIAGSVVGRRHIYSSSMSDELWGSVLSAGIWENGMWKAMECKSSERRAIMLCQGLQAASLPPQQLSLPTKALSPTMKGITAFWWKKNKSHRQAAKFPQFGLVTFLDLWTWN